MRRWGREQASLGERCPVWAVTGGTRGGLGEVDGYAREKKPCEMHLGPGTLMDGKVMIALAQLGGPGAPFDD